MNDKKNFLKSKRFWGIVTCIIGKILPIITPDLAPLSDHLTEAGALIFGVGCMDAKKPLKIF